MLGLGLGLSKGSTLLSNLKLLTRNSDWAIWGDKASGQSFPTLAERTLPNGVKNGIHTKNVSDDTSLLFSNSWAFIDATKTNYVTVRAAVTDIGLTNCAVPIVPNTTITNMMLWTGWTEKAYNGAIGDTYLPNSFSYRNLGSVGWVYAYFPFGTTLEQAKTLLTGIVTRYQLATPVDTLNSPQVNPIVDLVGTADGTLQGFGFIPTSGYVDVVAPNGKTVTGIQGDGVNDVIVLPSNAPNPTTGSFAFGLVVKTGTNKVKYWLTRNATNDTDTQYAFKMDASGNLFVILEGTAIQIGTALSVGFHSIWLERDSGTLKAFIDGVETYTGAHAVTLTTRPNVVMMASTTGAGTYTGFSNDLLLASKYCDSDIAKNRADWFKFDTKAYGL